MSYDPLALAPQGRRAARRAEQRRRKARRARLVAGVLALAVAVVTVVLVSGGGGAGKGKTAARRTQRTLLLQVRGPAGTAVASALLAQDPASGDAAVVLVPPQVIVSVPGAGSQAFGRAMLAGAHSARDALADLMGVTVDGSWVLDVATFEKLIDTEGGVQVTVDVPVMDGRVIVVQPGAQRLDGAHAYAYATFLAPGEPEQSRLVRLQGVVEGIVAGLPKDAGALVGSLGTGSSPSLSARVVGDVLSGLASSNTRQQLQYRSLPVIKVDAGTDDIRFRIDADGTRALVDALLAASVPPGIHAGGNRVLVLNGVGTPGLGQTVRTKLVRGGFVFVGSRNAPTFGYATTLVLVKDATQAGAALGAKVAHALGVPVSAVRASDQVPTFADVVVIVGRDFRTN